MQYITNMVRIDNKDKQTPNSSELKKFREILNLPKSKMGSFFKSHGVSKIGDRVYISIENGQKTEMKKIIDIAFAFNKEFKKRNLNNEVVAADLVTDLPTNLTILEKKDENFKTKDEDDSKTTSVTLEQIINAENLFKNLQGVQRKKVYNLGAMPPASTNLIKVIFRKIEEFNSSHEMKYGDEEDESFSREKKILDFSEDVNSALNELNNDFNIKLFMTQMNVIHVDGSEAYDLDMDKPIENQWELVLSHHTYLLYYFTYYDADSVTATYTKT